MKLTPLVVTVAAVALSSCSSSVGGATAEQPQVTIAASYEAYDTLEALRSGADVVLHGTITELSEVSFEEGDLAMAYYTIDVKEWVKDNAGLRDKGEILISVPAQESGFPVVQQLRPGQQIVIFGEHISPESAPVSIPTSGLIVPLGGANGLLDISGSTATARSPELRALTRAELDQLPPTPPQTTRDGEELPVKDKLFTIPLETALETARG